MRGENPSGPLVNGEPMLLELQIENLLLIERAELRLGPGLNAITGETGAGETDPGPLLRPADGKPRARSGLTRPGAEPRPMSRE